MTVKTHPLQRNLPPNQYYGKICVKHPKLIGARFKGACVECKRVYNNARRAKYQQTPLAKIKSRLTSNYKKRNLVNRMLGLSCCDIKFLMIKELACRLGREIDHLYPLNGEMVSGLHVPWNLRLVTREANVAKNKSHPNDFYKRDISIHQIWSQP